MKLTDQEVSNPVWLKLKQELERQLKAAREQNDAQLDEIETAALRGKIANLKRVLAIGEPGPEIEL